MWNYISDTWSYDILSIYLQGSNGFVLARALLPGLGTEDSHNLLPTPDEQGALQAWRYKIGKAESPKCRHCGKVAETGDHLVFVCEEWKELQREVWEATARRWRDWKEPIAETGQLKGRTHRASLWCGT